MNRLLCLFLVFFSIIPVRAEVAGRQVLIAAHRGGYASDKADAAPGNSVANVAVAVAKGFDLYESDIQRTRYGVFVIVHDETLDRETTGQGQVSDLTLLELPALMIRQSGLPREIFE
jgi:glycerophosphoryl diester phosphodiesterase